MKIRIDKYLVILLIIVLFLSLISLAQTFYKVHGAWRGVPPEFTPDTNYYLSRINQVSRGYPFAGNPYIFEYRNSTAPSFFVADWFSAIPLLLGLSLTGAIAFNLVFWSAILCVLGHSLFLKLGLRSMASSVATLLCYLQIYWLMVRPVVMQVVFPSYLLFILAYILWFRFPESKKRNLFLIFSSALSFYVYTYLWQIVCVTFALTYIFFFVKRDRKALRTFFVSNLIIGVLILPMIIYTVKQIMSPYYWETMSRIGMMASHIPTINVYYYGRWVILAILLGILLQFTGSNKLSQKFRQNVSIFLISGLSLLVASASNVVIGKEMETAIHIGRFIMLWFSIAFAYYLVYILKNKKGFFELPPAKITAISLIIFISAYGQIRNLFDRSLPFGNIARQDMVTIQDYSRPLEWLEKNAPSEQVIWTNNKIGSYVPVLTKHYLLFNLSAGLQLIPSEELEERYLVSRYFNDPTYEEIKNDFGTYALNVQKQSEINNRAVKLCRLFFIEKFGHSCGQLEMSISFGGEKYFQDLYNKYKEVIKPNINEELSKFNVAYLLIDKYNDALRVPVKTIKNFSEVYHDDRFEIYSYDNDAK